MFEFLLSIRVSFWLAWVGRMPRRCAATASMHRTKSMFLNKIPHEIINRKLHFSSNLLERAVGQFCTSCYKMSHRETIADKNEIFRDLTS